MYDKQYKNKYLERLILANCNFFTNCNLFLTETKIYCFDRVILETISNIKVINLQTLFILYILKYIFIENKK